MSWAWTYDVKKAKLILAAVRAGEIPTGTLCDGPSNRTLLMLATQHDLTTELEHLIRVGEEVNAKDAYHHTALSLSLDKDIAGTRLLLEHGAEPNGRNEVGRTTLMMACAKANLLAVQELVAHGADVNATDDLRLSALAAAANAAAYPVVEWLLEHGAVLPDRAPQNSTFDVSILCLAARHDDLRTAKLLIDNGANVHFTDKDGFAPLHYAHSVSMMELLLDNGADVNVVGPAGATVFMQACKRGDATMAALLLERGADFHIQNDGGRAVCTWACQGRSLGILELALDCGAPLHFTDGRQQILLLEAAWRGWGAGIRRLLNAGADVNVSADGDSVLSIALFGGDAHLAPLSIAAGADLTDVHSPRAEDVDYYE